MNNSNNKKQDYLFVYGTLLSQIDHPMAMFIKGRGTFIAKGYMAGKLYMLEHYPCAVATDQKNCWVQGELYHLPDIPYIWDELDRYEECHQDDPHPHEYTRTQQLITLMDGKKRIAWVYLYNRDITGLQEIPSGNFLQWKENKRE